MPFPIKLVNISVSLKNSLYFVRFDVSVRESMTEDIKVSNQSYSMVDHICRFCH